MMFLFLNFLPEKAFQAKKWYLRKLEGNRYAQAMQSQLPIKELQQKKNKVRGFQVPYTHDICSSHKLAQVKFSFM